MLAAIGITTPAAAPIPALNIIRVLMLLDKKNSAPQAANIARQTSDVLVFPNFKMR